MIMAQLRDRLISWEDVAERSNKLKDIIEREQGRMALYVHTGGGCLGRFENGKYLPVFKGSEKYLANIVEALSEEKGVALLLGAYYEGINGIQTQVRVIDLPSVPDLPIPYIGQEMKWGDFSPWEPVVEQLKRIGVTDISPFGGEVARFDDEGRVNGMCVNGALLTLRKHFDVTVYPQLCANELGNQHIISGQPISVGKYTLKAGAE